MGDEDTHILTKQLGDNYVTGRRVGVGSPIDPAPLVFRQKRKPKKYDDSEFRPLAENYPSAPETKDIISRQFEEEERLGWMYPLSGKEAKRRFGERLRIASLAAIPKDEQTVRVIFDGTHSVHVNNEIVLWDRLEFPSPSELAHSVTGVWGGLEHSGRYHESPPEVPSCTGGPWLFGLQSGQQFRRSLDKSCWDFWCGLCGRPLWKTRWFVV